MNSLEQGSVGRDESSWDGPRPRSSSGRDEDRTRARVNTVFSLYEKCFFESFKHLFKEMAPKRWSLCLDFIAFLYVYESSRFGSCCENMAGFISPLSKTFNLKAQNTDTTDVQVINYNS